MATSAGQPFVAAYERLGGTSLDIAGLALGTTYYFKVRAFDSSGVGDTNNAEVSISLSNSAPTFAGVSSASPSGAYAGTVGWSAASDDTTPTGSIVYEVHVAELPAQSFTTRVVTAAGATSAVVTGLHPNTRYYVQVRARDADGQRDTNTAELSFVTADDAGAHPTIGNYVPTPGTPIGANDGVTFDVTGANSLRRVIVSVTSADTGIAEVVHDGDSFSGRFVNGSSRVGISGGYRYTIKRQGGWTGAPTFRVYATDVTGLED